MSAKNMAIVMSPNLMQVETENPMVALTMAQQAADYTLALLQAYIDCGGDNRPADPADPNADA